MFYSFEKNVCKASDVGLLAKSDAIIVEKDSEEEAIQFMLSLGANLTYPSCGCCPANWSLDSEESEPEIYSIRLREETEQQEEGSFLTWAHVSVIHKDGSVKEYGQPESHRNKV
jgi:hypothetical protein